MTWSGLELFDFGHEKGPIRVEVDTRESIELSVESWKRRHVAGEISINVNSGTPWSLDIQPSIAVTKKKLIF